MDLKCILPDIALEILGAQNLSSGSSKCSFAKQRKRTTCAVYDADTSVVDDDDRKLYRVTATVRFKPWTLMPQG